MRLILVLSLGLLITAIYSACTIDQQAFEALRHFPLHYALLLLAMALLPWFTSTIRLSVWMTFLKHPVRFNELFRIILAADAVAAVTPTAVGGGYFKFGWLIKRGVPAGPAASLMILGTLEEYAFFLISIPAVFWFSPAARGVFIEIWNKLPAGTWRGEEVFSYVVLPLIGMALAGQLMWRFMNEAHKTRLRNFWRGVRRQAKLGFDTLRMVAAKGGWRFAVTVGLAGVHWVCRCSLLVILLEGLRQQLDAMSVIISQWLLFMLMNFMPSPGAVGGAEFGFVLFYRALLPENFVGVLSTVWRILTFTLPVGLAALVFLWQMRKDKNTRSKNTSPSSLIAVEPLDTIDHVGCTIVREKSQWSTQDLTDRQFICK